MIDKALGESSYVRYHSPTLRAAVHGLFRALDGWRGVATHLERLSEGMDRQEAETILRFRLSCDRRRSQARRHGG
jgi:hypothetical protein